MPHGFEIRNKHIEKAHRVDCGEVVTRKMTPEEWAKYGPPNLQKGMSKMSKPKINFDTLLKLAKEHGLEKEGREQIAQKLGVTRKDISNYICRPHVKKALIEAGILPEKSDKKPDSKEETKEKLVHDIAQQLNVSIDFNPPKTIEDIQPTNTISKDAIHLNLCGFLHEIHKTESIQDTLLNLACYCLTTIMKVRGGAKE